MSSPLVFCKADGTVAGERGLAVKLQYMGDRRDLYKYDLLLALARSNELAKNITVIPMLTHDTNSKEGRLRSYRTGLRDHDVHRFVKSLVSGDPAGFESIKEFFAQKNVTMQVSPEMYLERDNRDAYFAAINDADLDGRIVFLDPDIGLEAKSSSSRDVRYLHFEEVENIYSRLSKPSILVLYQHMPRREHAAAYADWVHSLFELAGISDTYFIDMGDIGFILAAYGSDHEHQMQLAKTVGEFTQSRGVRYMSAGASRVVVLEDAQAPKK